MDDFPFPYRRATRDDAPALAELIDMAGDGVPSIFWARMAQPGETSAEVGQRRARRDEGSFSFRNAVVADPGEGPVAALLGYPLPHRTVPIPPDIPPMFVPLQEIENLAAGTWYVNALATRPSHRGQGHGARLVALADRLAQRTGRTSLSLAVMDSNEGARRFYDRLGFRLAASRPLVKAGWPGRGDHVLLLVRDHGI
jgi:ribosomal protein S18 acetylase RimI-like enzyme